MSKTQNETPLQNDSVDSASLTAKIKLLNTELTFFQDEGNINIINTPLNKSEYPRILKKYNDLSKTAQKTTQFSSDNEKNAFLFELNKSLAIIAIRANEKKSLDTYLSNMRKNNSHSTDEFIVGIEQILSKLPPKPKDTAENKGATENNINILHTALLDNAIKEVEQLINKGKYNDSFEKIKYLQTHSLSPKIVETYIKICIAEGNSLKDPAAKEAAYEKVFTEYESILLGKFAPGKHSGLFNILTELSKKFEEINDYENAKTATNIAARYNTPTAEKAAAAVPASKGAQKALEEKQRKEEEYRKKEEELKRKGDELQIATVNAETAEERDAAKLAYERNLAEIEANRKLKLASTQDTVPQASAPPPYTNKMSPDLSNYTQDTTAELTAKLTAKLTAELTAKLKAELKAELTNTTTTSNIYPNLSSYISKDTTAEPSKDTTTITTDATAVTTNTAAVTTDIAAATTNNTAVTTDTTTVPTKDTTTVTTDTNLNTIAAEKLVREVTDLLNSNEEDPKNQAIVLCNKAIRTNPNIDQNIKDSTILKFLALRYFDLNQQEKAEEIYDKVTLTSDDVPAMVCLVSSYLSSNNLKKAQEICDKIMAIDLNAYMSIKDRKVLDCLAKVYRAEGLYTKSIETCEQSYKLKSTPSLENYQLLKEIAQRLENTDTDLALKALAQAELQALNNKQKAEVYVARAKIYSSLGKNTEATEDCKKAVTTDPKIYKDVDMESLEMLSKYSGKPIVSYHYLSKQSNNNSVDLNFDQKFLDLGTNVMEKGFLYVETVLCSMKAYFLSHNKYLLSTIETQIKSLKSCDASYNPQLQKYLAALNLPDEAQRDTEIMKIAGELEHSIDYI